MTDDVWNDGEKAWQERVGSREQLAMLGPRILREAMPDQHRELFEKLPFVVLAGVDAGQPRSALVHGPRGLVHTPDARTLVIDATTYAGDLDVSSLAPGDSVGMLGIELATRRRNRVNGRITAVRGRVLQVHVEQSFGNCPKYIHPRTSLPAFQDVRVAEEGELLGPDSVDVITRAVTFFIATTARPDPSRATKRSEGVDVSHRGGPPGFVRAHVEDGVTVLSWPDYPGNDFYNTFGNLLLHPLAGLLFIDFASGGVVAVSGRAEILDGAGDREVRVVVDSAERYAFAP